MMNIETLLQAAQILESQQSIPPKKRLRSEYDSYPASFFSLLCLVGSEDVYVTISNESCTWLTLNSCKHLEIKKRTDKKRL